MTIKDWYKVLEIEPTESEKEVKIAYASHIKKYHPEENPEEWKRIHDAYTVIMDYLRNRGEFVLNHPSWSDTSTNNISNEMNNAPRTEDDYSEDIDLLLTNVKNRYNRNRELEQQALLEKEKDKEKYSELVQEIRELFKVKRVAPSGKPLISARRYRKVREIPHYYEAIGNVNFIDCLYRIFKGICFDAHGAEEFMLDMEIAQKNYPSNKRIYKEIIEYVRLDATYVRSSRHEETWKILCAGIIVIAVLIALVFIMFCL